MLRGVIIFFDKAKGVFLHKKKRHHNEFLHQQVHFKRVENRIDFFKFFCKNKVVIHFGCTDYPIFNKSTNLHIKLSVFTKRIVGFDIDTKGINTLKEYVDQPYYSSFTESLKEEFFDVCLVPETIEHVDNVGDFLRNIKEYVYADLYIITAPNCFAIKYWRRNHEEDEVYHEYVHPDHNYWFSPYTLMNCVKKYTDFLIEEVVLLEKDSMVAIVAKRK